MTEQISFPELPQHLRDTCSSFMLDAIQAYAREHEANVRAELARSARAVPEGFVLVPREPTSEMLDAATDEEVHVCEQGDPYYSDRPMSEGDAGKVWKAMLAVAPTALPAVTPQVADEGRESASEWKSRVLLEACSKWSGAQKIEAGDIIEWLADFRINATPPPMAAVPAQTVPWPTITAYSGGADSGGVAAWVKVQLGDGPETVEFVRKDLVPAVPAQAGVAPLDWSPGTAFGDLVSAVIDWYEATGVGATADAAKVVESRLAALAHSPTVASPAVAPEPNGETGQTPDLQLARDCLDDAMKFAPDTERWGRWNRGVVELDMAIATSPALVAEVGGSNAHQ